MKINFITGNNGKVISLKKAFESRNRKDIEVVQQKLEIIEPQLDTVKEVSRNKALQAYKILNESVLVEDGGFFIDALKGFPGVYTKYILDTIGVEGLLKLMENETDRRCGFISCMTYIDEKGNMTQFDSSDTSEGELVAEMMKIKCEEAWSDIWYIYKIKSTGKTLAEHSVEKQKLRTECKSCTNSKQKIYNIDTFSDWYIKNY